MRKYGEDKKERSHYLALLAIGSRCRKKESFSCTNGRRKVTQGISICCKMEEGSDVNYNRKRKKRKPEVARKKGKGKSN